MLARLLRTTTLGLLAAALLWAAAWGYTGHATVALLGAVFILGLPAWVLAFEFAMMVRHNRGDPAPPATTWQLLSSWAVEVWIFYLVFGWRQPFREHAIADAPQATGRRGIVFIHGYMCNRGLWAPWFERLRREQVPYVSVSLEPVYGSIDGYASQVEEAVRRIEQSTGQPPVLVCHSMGGTVARAWLRWQAAAGGREDRVHRVITLGSPHGGTWMGHTARTPNGRQMRIRSSWLQELAASEPEERRNRFVCFYSHCDNMVFPASSAVLPGSQARHLPGVAHVQLAYEEAVYDEVLANVGPAPQAAVAVA